jgi:acetyl-CoA C-acetyltransferase
MAVASGFVDCAAVVGVEKVTDRVGPGLESAVAEGADYDYEAAHGLTLAAQAALLMRRYMHESGVPREVFGEFPILAHANAVHNPNAMFRKAISRKAYEAASSIGDPLNLFDMAPYADGAAAVILARSDCVPSELRHPLVRVTGSAAAADTLALHDRPYLLAFEAVRHSTEKACRMAGILPGDADFFELCDAFSIFVPLTLEAAGLAKRGEGWKMALDGSLQPGGKLPILTLGGHKARGNPLGAAGMYQIVEAVLQLRGQADAGQLSKARRALVQSLGGPASSAVTHVLERWD